MRYFRKHSFYKMISQLFFMFDALGHRLSRKLRGFSETDYRGDVQCSRAPASFLSAAVYKRAYLYAFSYIQYAYSLGSVKLMSACGKHIYIHFFNVYRYMPVRLNRVGMEQNPVFTGYLSDLLNRLERSYLVVRHHDTY